MFVVGHMSGIKWAPRWALNGPAGPMDEEEWLGLTVRARDGTVLGGVVGVFAEGPLAGRLRVEGADAPSGSASGPWDGIAVYAIPRHAVVRRQGDSLLLGVTRSVARGRWLMHVRQQNGP